MLNLPELIRTTTKIKNMKRLCWLLIAILFLTTTVRSQSISNAENWKNIDEALEQNLPETALKLLYQFNQQALEQKNLTQQVKIMLYELRIRAGKDPSQTGHLLAEAEKSTSLLPVSAEKQLMFLMLADAYHQYLSNNRFQLSQRTTVVTLSGESNTTKLPDELNEWSRGNVVQKITELVHLCFADSLLLQRRIIKQGDEFITADTLALQSATTWYDLVLQKMQDMDITEPGQGDKNYWLKRQLAFRRSQPEIFPLVIAELRLIHQQYENNNQPGAYQQYISRLDSLHTLYNHHPEVVEILSELASAYINNESEKGGKRIAFRLCEEGIKRFPHYQRIHLLKNTQLLILTPSIQISTNRYFSSKEPIVTTLTTTNIKRLKVELHRIVASMPDYLKSYYETFHENRNKPYPNTLLVDSQWIDITQVPDFSSITDTIQFEDQDYGMYEVRVTSADSLLSFENNNPFPHSMSIVTDLTAIRRMDGKQRQVTYVVDRTTGTPVKGVEVGFFRREWVDGIYKLLKQHQLKSNREGEIQLTSDQHLPTLTLVKGKDAWCYLDIYPQYYPFENAKRLNTHIGIFTDRSIYRPGQVVYYKTIAYKSGMGIEKVIPDTTLEVQLQRNSSTLVGNQKVTTNSHGSATGSFVLPDDAPGEYYSLKIGSKQISFQVEEYKRPTFEVELSNMNDEVAFGKEVKLKGLARSLAGFPIQQARVKYSIERRMMAIFRHFPWFRQEQVNVTDGELTTDNNGIFNLSFIPVTDPGESFKGTNYYHFLVKVEVTSLNGETQKGQTGIRVGERSMFLSASANPLWEQNSQEWIKVEARSLNDSLLTRMVNYELYYLADDGKFREDQNPEYRNRKLVKSGSFVSSDSLQLNLKESPTGHYRIKFSSLDNRNDTIVAEKDFIMYNAGHRRPPVTTYLWNPAPEMEAQPGSKVKLTIGTSVKKAWILYEVEQGSNTLSRQWIKLNARNRQIDLQLPDTLKDGVVARFALVHNGKLHSTQISVRIPNGEKILKPVLSTFRDKLQPGSKENWTVNLPGYRGTDAELLAGMYDASLDQLQQHNWVLYTSNNASFSDIYPWYVTYRNETTAAWSGNPPFADVQGYTAASFNFYGSPEALAGSGHDATIYRPILIRGGSKMKAMTDGVVETFEVVSIRVSNENRPVVTGSGTLQEEVMPMQIRENFTETAFFYPQLRADSSGIFHLDFTLPESLTRWKLKLLAHTPDFHKGQSEYTFESRKDLMVQLNLPRFVRQSDRWEVKANVVNRTSTVQTVVVKLTLSDYAQPTHSLFGTEKTIELAAGHSGVVSWEVPSLKNSELVIARAEARSGSFSDGEQRYLPVLSDNMLVTESVPFMLREGERKEIGFATSIDVSDVRRQVVEFTAHPAWAAVQALPLLAVPETDNAIDLLGALYSSVTARTLLNRHPEIKQHLRSIQLQGVNNESLISQLEKNQDLKIMVLNATPWLVEANNHTEQQRQLIRLFDEQQQLHNEETMLRKLSNLQLPSGAFSWMSGMPANRYITQLTLEKLQRMYSDESYDNRDQLKPLIEKAILYLDSQLANDYAQLKRYDTKFESRKTITVLQLHYLAIRALVSAKPDLKESLEAISYYHRQVQTYRHGFGIYEKAIAAQFFHRSGDKTQAAEMLKSLREQAVIHPEKGMYWPKLRSSWLWNERPLSIHVRALEAFQDAGGTPGDTGMLQLWLLNQKRTNQWDSRLTTLEAVAALLTSDTNWFSADQKFSFKSASPAGLTELKPIKVLPGSGYFKMNLEPEHTKLVVESMAVTATDGSKGSSAPGSTPAWGALYRQSMQPIERIQASGSELQLERSYYQQLTRDGSKQLVKINNNSRLQPGDKIISRLVIRAQRDFEFVVLSDSKAASLEIADQLSQLRYHDGLMYYRNPGDLATRYFINYLPKGSYILEEEYYLTHHGEFSGGIAQIQCLYAPEFVSTSSGFILKTGQKSIF
jgi:hypothetical protein